VTRTRARMAPVGPALETGSFPESLGPDDTRAATAECQSAGFPDIEGRSRAGAASAHGSGSDRRSAGAHEEGHQEQRASIFALIDGQWACPDRAPVGTAAHLVGSLITAGASVSSASAHCGLERDCPRGIPDSFSGPHRSLKVSGAYPRESRLA
jgi:hypothetical protein